MNSKALIRAATITVAWVAVATIGSELFADFKELLSRIGGHHWIGKSVLTAGLYGLIYFIFSKFLDDRYSLRETVWLTGAVIVSGLAILIFYIMHC